MTLHDYIKSFPRRQRTLVRQQLAAFLGISEVYVRSMCNGHKSIQSSFALRIETFTGGLVSRHELAPDHYPLETKRNCLCENLQKFPHNFGLTSKGKR